MADVKISALPAAASIGSADVFPIVQSGVTKKVAASVLRTPLTGATDPNGLVTAAVGTIYTQVTGGTATLWINVDGATAWV